MTWVVHGILLGNLSFVTVLGYVATPLATKKEIWWTMATYVVGQFLLTAVGFHF